MGGFPQSLEEWLGQAVNLNSKGVSTWNKRERISQSAAIQNISDTIMYIHMYKYMYIYDCVHTHNMYIHNNIKIYNYIYTHNIIRLYHVIHT